MLDDAARDMKERLLTPIALRMDYIHPSAVTALSLLFGLGAVILAWYQSYWWCVLLIALNRLLDGLDGTVARLHAKQSDFGGYVDILADFMFYALLPIALVLADPTEARYIALVLLLASYYLNAASWMYLSAILEKRYQGSAARKEITTVTMPAALIGGLETTILYPVFALIPSQISLLFGLMASLVVISVGQRLVWAWRNLQ